MGKKDLAHEPSEWCDVAILQPEFTSHRLEKDEDIGVIDLTANADHSLTDVLSNMKCHVLPSSKKAFSWKNNHLSPFNTKGHSSVSRSSSFAPSSSYSAWSIPKTNPPFGETPQYTYQERHPLLGDTAVPLYQRPPPPIPDYRELQSHHKKKQKRSSRSG